MICRLTPKSCVMYAGLRLAKTFVCCCPDQLNKRLTDSKIESVRRKLCSVREKSTFVVASSQSQRVVCARQRLLLRSGRDNSTIVFCCCIAIQKTFVGFSRLVYARHKGHFYLQSYKINTCKLCMYVRLLVFRMWKGQLGKIIKHL